VGTAEALRAFVWPALAALLVLAIAWRLTPRGRRTSAEPRPWAAPLAVALAAALGHALLNGWPWRPNESWRWLAWIAVSGGALGIMESASRSSVLGTWIVRALVLGASVTLLLLRVAHKDDGLDVGRVALDAAAALAGWLVFAPAVAAHGARLGPVLLFACGSAVSAMVLFSANLRVALLGAALCGGLAALALSSWRRPSPRGLAGATSTAALLFACLAIAAVELGYPGFSPAWYAAVALAPLASIAAGSRLIPIGREPARSIARLAIALAVLATGVLAAWRAYASSPY
jgi:hypothetical protein